MFATSCRWRTRYGGGRSTSATGPTQARGALAAPAAPRHPRSRHRHGRRPRRRVHGRGAAAVAAPSCTADSVASCLRGAVQKVMSEWATRQARCCVASCSATRVVQLSATALTADRRSSMRQSGGAAPDVLIAVCLHRWRSAQQHACLQMHSVVCICSRHVCNVCVHCSGLVVVSSNLHRAE